MQIALALSLLVALTSAMPAAHQDGSVEWEAFKATHGKFYAAPEVEELRRKIYFQNKEFIEAHNQRYEQGLTTFSMKMNHFGDMLHHEVLESRNGLKRGLLLSSSGLRFNATNEEVPASIDWRQKGAVTAVKDQGQCGSCWAFSTTGSLEGQWALKKGKLVSLSEQQLVDCSGNFGNNGCGGGLMDSAFNYIKSNGGIDTEQSYPYTAEDGYCQFNKKNVAASVTGFVDIPSEDESALQQAVATIGPISIAIDASQMSFTYYSQGVYEDSGCSSESLDHGVLAVGYGVEGGVPYWIVKNSWGPSWGQAGYIKMRRNQGNMCGVATQASYPLV